MEFEIMGYEIPILVIILFFLKIAGKFIKNVKIMIVLSISAIIVGLLVGIWLGVKITGI